jgi:predicted lipoprotein with Yx(FWY)xxD motif
VIARKDRPLLAVTLAAAIGLLAACGSSGGSGGGKYGSGATTTSTASTSPTTTANTPTTVASTPTTAVGAAAAVVDLSTTSLGLTLVDASGHTLYQHQPDPKGSSTCTGACATIWPPLTTSAATVTVGAHLSASLFSIVMGAGGSHIVAISGHPLYRFSGDTKPGDTNGQGMGGQWHAAGPLGGTM